MKNVYPELVDRLISAEIPDKCLDIEGYNLVEQHMIHGPCGNDRPNSPCMDNGVCSKKFPKAFVPHTRVDDTGYVVYRRRENDRFVTKGHVKLDNRFVVPHNLQLLKKFRAHINVEWCNRSSAIKYLFKYITKGVDRATMVIQKGHDGNDQTKVSEGSQSVDEINAYLDCRYLSACESMWRIFSFHIHHHHPPVQRLSLHLPEQQPTLFAEDETLESVEQRYGKGKTMLTEWFELNKYSDEARGLKYVELPAKFRWDKPSKMFIKRKRQENIGRIVNIHPASGELYYLRTLLNIVRGPTSFEDLLLVGGVKYPTFKAACHARGLLGDDKEWHDAMDEATQWASPSSLRSLFVLMLVYCEVSEPGRLWMHCWESMSEDILHKQRKLLNFPNLELKKEEVQQYCLIEIENLLQQYDRSIMDYADMPIMNKSVLEDIHTAYFQGQNVFDISAEKAIHDSYLQRLNRDQKNIYDNVIASVNNREGKLFFVNGPGGTGKTFVYKTIIAALRSAGKRVLPVASSAIAALLLPGGRTAHSVFKIPISINEDSVCEIKKNSVLAQSIINTDLIIWDEAPMAHRHIFEAVDRTMQDLQSSSNTSSVYMPFGGKTVLLGGDFRQILPVIPQGTRQETVVASINRSCLWDSCHTFLLKQNMRLHDDDLDFAEWILKVGDGTAERASINSHGEEDHILIDSRLMLPITDDPLELLFRTAYPDFERSYANHKNLLSTSILAPRNEHVDEVNGFVLGKIPGPQVDYLSCDSIDQDNQGVTGIELSYPTEFLNALEFPGLPAHKLSLKVGAPIMLMRNLNQREGLCNGTRLIVTHLGERVINAEILSSSVERRSVTIPRITLSPQDSKHPFVLKRRQFPIRLSYAMTINKSQGQTLQRVALYLPTPVFSHGQLYVALSRVSTKDGLAILDKTKKQITEPSVVNIVYREAFHKLPS